MVPLLLFSFSSTLFLLRSPIDITAIKHWKDVSLFFEKRKVIISLLKKLGDASVSIQKNNTDSMIN